MTDIKCPECGKATLCQTRVRVFPRTDGAAPEGGTVVVEQDSGSTLVTRSDDLEFPRPGPDPSAAVTILYTCEACGTSDMPLHLFQIAGVSTWAWEASPGQEEFTPDVGSLPLTPDMQRQLGRLRDTVDEWWQEYLQRRRVHSLGPVGNEAPVDEAQIEEAQAAFQTAVCNLRRTVVAWRSNGYTI